MNKKIKAYIALCVVTFIWGFSFISTKICLNWFEPMPLAFFRFLVATIVLFIAILVTKGDFRIEKNDIFRTVLLGFTGIFLYFTFENISLKLINASMASILVSLLPALTVIADYIVIRKRISKYKIFSVLLSVAGAILVAGFSSNESSKNVLLGAILIILSLLSWIVYCYLTLPIQQKYSTMKITFYQTMFGTVFFAFTLPFSNVSLTSFNMTGLLNLLFLGIFCSAICYILYNYSMIYTNVIVCSIFINMIPIVTVTASIILLNEKLSLVQFLGAVLIIISVLVVTYEERLASKYDSNDDMNLL